MLIFDTIQLQMTMNEQKTSPCLLLCLILWQITSYPWVRHFWAENQDTGQKLSFCNSDSYVTYVTYKAIYWGSMLPKNWKCLVFSILERVTWKLNELWVRFTWDLPKIILRIALYRDLLESCPRIACLNFQTSLREGFWRLFCGWNLP